MNTSLFGTLEGRVRHRVLQTSTYRETCNQESRRLTMSFDGFVQIYACKTTTRGKRSALLLYSVHIMLLDFSKDYKTV